jgi:hypothetical protein
MHLNLSFGPFKLITFFSQVNGCFLITKQVVRVFLIMASGFLQALSIQGYGKLDLLVQELAPLSLHLHHSWMLSILFVFTIMMSLSPSMTLQFAKDIMV